MMVNCLFYNHGFNLYLFIILTWTAPSTKAKVPPGPAFTIPELPFDSTIDKRGNWCDKQTLIYENNLDLKLALANETISIALNGNWSSYVNYLDMDAGVIKENDPGVLIELLEEVADRGQFKWEYGVVYDYTPILKVNKTFTDLLVWLTDNFDVAADWWLQTPQRVEKGVTYPMGWYDGSIVIIGTKGSSLSFFSWLTPFSIQVWILLIATLLLTGILCYALETRLKIPKCNNLEELSRFTADFTDYISMSMMVFTGHMNLKTKTKAGQLVTFSLSLFAMLMLSAYTANLASFLVTKNSQGSNIDLTKIVTQKKTMCIVKAAKFETIKIQYPNANFLFKTSEEEIYKGLSNKECDYAIASLSGWEEIKDKKGYNWGCELERVDPPGKEFRRFEAGFAMKSDSGDKCTSLVREVFHVHLLEMQSSLIIKEKWDNHVYSNHDESSCSRDDIDDLQTLDLRNMGGVFILHFALLVIAIFFTLGGKWHDRRCRQPNLVNKNLLEVNEKSQAVGNRFYSFASSRGLRDTVLKEFSIDSNLPNKGMLGENCNYGAGTDFSTTLHTGESKKIENLENSMKLILEKLDKMAASGGRIDLS